MRSGITQMSRMRLMCAAVILATMQAPALFADGFTQTNLVSDVPGLAAITDSNLKNPWGVSFSGASPFWVSNQATSTSDLFTVHGLSVSQNALEVSIPKTASGPQGPTGQVNNNTPAFPVNGTPASFIFANLNGTISAWNNSAGTTAQIKATTPGAVYTGLAISNVSGTPLLYAANNAGNGSIDVFDGSFTLLSAASHPFMNPFPGLVPFNVQNIGGKIYVTYVLPGRAAQISATEGEGAVAIFDTNGILIQTLIDGSKLASPWGITLAPATFPTFGNDLLVANFSYAAPEINAFNPTTGAFLGQIISNLNFQGLWALSFGNGGSGGDPNILYFSTGLNGEKDGLFGAVTPVPEPSSLVLVIGGLGALACRRGVARLRGREYWSRGSGNSRVA
jgi:uncharacterized protein (TIGR03118 family)